MVRTYSLVHVASILALALLLVLPATAQQAYTPTASSQLLHGQLTLDDGQVVDFKVRDGQMLTVQREGESVRYGLLPKLDEAGGGSYTLRVLEITEHPSGAGEMIREVDQVTSVLGAVPRLLGGATFDVRFEAVSDLGAVGGLYAGLSKGLDSGNAPPETENTCCITCNGVTACGCAVTMSCGSCCAGACCGGDDGGGRGPLHDGY